MPWKYDSDDNFVDVIVDPDFDGDLIALASVRPVWIVDSSRNRPRIDQAWVSATDRELFEVSRCAYDDPSQRVENLLDILGCLDDHHRHHNVIVHGVSAAEIGSQIEAEGLQISEVRANGFVALQDTKTRDRLIGR